MTSVASLTRRRKRILLRHLVVYCLATIAIVNGQDHGGSAGGSAGVTGIPTTLPPVSSPPPATTTPATTTPSTTAPSPTTLVPTEAPKTTEPPVATKATTTPPPEETTVAPTVTPKPSKSAKNVTAAPPDAGPVTAETAAPVATASDRSIDSTPAPLAPGAAPHSGVSYGGKSTDSSSSQAHEVTTKSADTTKSAVQFVVVAAGVLAVVAAVAMSVHFQQKRRAKESELDEDDKYLNPVPKRPTTIDVNAPVSTTAATTSRAPTVLYDDFSTPAWRQKTVIAMTAPPPAPSPPPPQPVEKHLSVSAFRDSDAPVAASQSSVNPLAQSAASGIVTTAATDGLAATFVGRKAGENDVTGGEDVDRASAMNAYEKEDFREPRVTVKHITRCRGKSEASVVDDDNLSQYGADLLRSTFITDEEEGYTNTQMFAFSDSGSEGDRASERSNQSRGAGGAASDVSEFLKFYNGPIVATQVEVDVDADEYVDAEDIAGRSSRASSMAEDLRISDFTVGHTSRMSTSSSIADFHDSTVDRPSDLDLEEFEV